MIPGGPGPFGWPEEPDGPGDEERGAAGGPGGAGSGSGWIPPSERSWRHPSELGRAGEAGQAGTGGGLAGSARSGQGTRMAARPRHGHRMASMGVVTVAVVAVAIGSFLLMSTGEGPGTPGSTVQTAVEGPVTALASCCHLTAAAAHRAERGLVAIVTPLGGRLLGCGVVVAGAGLVATTADAVAGRRSVQAVTTGGRRLSATVVAVDPASDVALLSVRSPLPIARFADDDDVGPGFPATVMAMAMTRAGTRGRPAAPWKSMTVASVGTPVPRGDAAGMAAIMVRGRPGPSVPGQPLLDASGDVLGLLDRSGAGGDGTWPYLPSSLVVGVAEELATTGRVDHGWLDAQLAQAPSTTAAPVPTALASDATVGGAQVTAVDPGGPAVRALQPGDVIVAVDGQPVRSAAELRSQLYVLAPGERATVTALRDGHQITAVVELAPSP